MFVSPLLPSRITPSRLAASGPIEDRQATGNIMSAAASQTPVLSSVAPVFAGQIYSWLNLGRGPSPRRRAPTEEDRVAALRLRFQAVNVELNEGRKPAYATGQDRD